MSELRDLYQEVILDHSKRPRNFRKPEGSRREALGYNPLCGDKLTVYLDIEGGIVKDLSFVGSGCAISTASASMMTENLRGKTLADVQATYEKFHRMLTGKAGTAPGGLGKLTVFSGVSKFPVRVKCATLPWHTLQAALRNEVAAVSTE